LWAWFHALLRKTLIIRIAPLKKVTFTGSTRKELQICKDRYLPLFIAVKIRKEDLSGCMLGRKGYSSTNILSNGKQ